MTDKLHLEESPVALAESNETPLSLHIAHQEDDGPAPTHFLCGRPITVLFPDVGLLAGDMPPSECAECNRLDVMEVQ